MKADWFWIGFGLVIGVPLFLIGLLFIITGALWFVGLPLVFISLYPAYHAATAPLRRAKGK